MSVESTTQFWRYSIASANLSRCIALPIKIDESTAFTAGLVHSIGELMMHAAMPEAMMDLNQRVPVLDIKRAHAEQDLFGYSYGELGAALAQEWRFPQKMIDAIRHQAAPFEDDVYEPIAGVVHIASWRARRQEMSLSGEELISSYPDPIGMVLGINPDSVMEEMIPSFTRETDDAVSEEIQFGTTSPGDGEAVGGAAPSGSRRSCDRSTSYSRHSGKRRLPNPTAASWQSALVRPPPATGSSRCTPGARQLGSSVS